MYIKLKVYFLNFKKFGQLPPLVHLGPPLHGPTEWWSIHRSDGDDLLIGSDFSRVGGHWVGSDGRLWSLGFSKASCLHEMELIMFFFPLFCVMCKETGNKIIDSSVFMWWKGKPIYIYGCFYYCFLLGICLLQELRGENFLV